MSGKQINSVCIYGTHYAPLLTAITLVKLLPHLQGKVSIALNVNSEETDNYISSLHDFTAFHQHLGLNEELFINATEASLNFAIKYPGGFYSDGPQHKSIQGVDFHQAFENSTIKSALAIESCNPSIVAAQNCSIKQLLHQRKTNPMLSCYGFNIATEKLTNYYLALTESLSIPLHYCKSLAINNGAEAIIESIDLDGTKKLEADLFLDCSNNRALCRQTEVIPLTSIPHWNKEIKSSPKESQNNSYATYSVNTAEESLTKQASTQTTTYTSKLQFSAKGAHQASILQASWQGNTIAIGEAYLQNPSILIDKAHMLQSMLLQLVDLWPRACPQKSIRDIFNRYCKLAAMQIVDIDNLHISEKIDRNIAPTQKNKERIELFTSCGGIYKEENAIIPHSSWPLLLHAIGYRQQSTNIHSDALHQSQIDQTIGRWWNSIQQRFDKR